EFLSIPPVTGLDTFITPIKDIVELYGSTSGEDVAPLMIYEIYGVLTTDVKMTFELHKVFSPTLHTVVTQNIISPQVIMEKINEKGLEYWTPLFFSAGFYDSPLEAYNEVLLTESEAPKVNMSDIREGGE